MDNKVIHDTFLSLKNTTKGDVEKKCPGSLCFPLLVPVGMRFHCNYFFNYLLFFTQVTTFFMLKPVSLCIF